MIQENQRGHLLEVDCICSEADRIVAAVVVAVHMSHRTLHIVVGGSEAVGYSLEDHCKVVADIHIDFVDSSVE